MQTVGHKFILAFLQDGYDAEGAGIYVEYPETLDEMDKRCNELLTKGKNGCECTIVCAASIKEEYQYAPNEKILVYERIMALR